VQTDLRAGEALFVIAGALDAACCDDTAMAMIAAVPEGLREEIAGAVTDEDVRAVISGEGGEK
jgi:hypothetical protein